MMGCCTTTTCDAPAAGTTAIAWRWCRPSGAGSTVDGSGALTERDGAKGWVVTGNTELGGTMLLTAGGATVTRELMVNGKGVIDLSPAAQAGGASSNITIATRVP